MAKALLCPPELLALSLKGRSYVITGANSGIGLVTTEQLAQQGAQVIMACRNVSQGEAEAARIRARFPEASLEVLKLDLSRLESVRSFAAEVTARHSSLQGLINNAGVMNTPKEKTHDGFEMQFGTNHLGHFLLTELLLPALKNGAPSRIINLSSCYHDRAMGRDGDIHFEDLGFENEKYDGWKAYAQSKLANLLHAKELAKRLEGTEVTAVSVHPGWVRTRLARSSMPLWVQDHLLRPLLSAFGMIEPWQGAQTTLYALLSAEVPAHAGAFFSQTGMYRDKSCNAGGWPLHSPNPNAHDAQKAERLWQVSEKLVGLQA